MVVLHWKWIPVFVSVLFVSFIKNIKTVLRNEILNTEHKNCFKIIFSFNQLFNFKVFFDVLLTVHLSIFISVTNQLDAQNFCFTISLFHASTCFEHHVLETCRGMK